MNRIMLSQDQFATELAEAVGRLRSNSLTVVDLLELFNKFRDGTEAGGQVFEASVGLSLLTAWPQLLPGTVIEPWLTEYATRLPNMDTRLLREPLQPQAAWLCELVYALLVRLRLYSCTGWVEELGMRGVSPEAMGQVLYSYLRFARDRELNYLLTSMPLPDQHAAHNNLGSVASSYCAPIAELLCRRAPEALLMAGPRFFMSNRTEAEPYFQDAAHAWDLGLVPSQIAELLAQRAHRPDVLECLRLRLTTGSCSHWPS